MEVSDIDLLIAADQKGIQALLKRLYFTPTAVQFSKHYEISPKTKSPNRHRPISMCVTDRNASPIKKMGIQTTSIPVLQTLHH